MGSVGGRLYIVCMTSQIHCNLFAHLMSVTLSYCLSHFLSSPASPSRLQLLISLAAGEDEVINRHGNEPLRQLSLIINQYR